MLEARELTKKYGSRTVVDHLSFTIRERQICGFLGVNGAGKSTTMNMLTGCLAPTSGDVLLDGVSILDGGSAVRQKIGYLPEIPPVYLEMTPREYLSFVAALKAVPKKQIPQAVDRALEATQITAVRDRLIGNLSKGYRQRVGISQAVLAEPELVILDEPTVGLDPEQLLQIRQLITELGKTHTVILSSHILSEIQAVCTELLVIVQGRLAACGGLRELERSYSGRARLELCARCGRQQAEQLLQPFAPQLTDMCMSQPDEQHVLIQADCASGAELAEALSVAFVTAGVCLQRLAVTEDTLEELFLKLTAQTGKEMPQ